MKKTIAIISVLSLSACGSVERIANIGAAPELTKIENPVEKSDYRPVSLPMPEKRVPLRQRNSLWADSSKKTFFEDQRASEIGDILTVLIDINDEAELENASERSRTSSENAGLDNFLGYEGSLGRILPEAVTNADLVGADSDSSHSGEGSIEREEEIRLRLAAVVTQVLPNGNLVIQGRQEVAVNFEKRILQMTGVIRPEDISINNTIASDQIAEARIAYGGEGQITDVQQPRYGQQLYDILFPF